MASLPSFVTDFGSGTVNGLGNNLTVVFSLSGVTAKPALLIGGVDFTSGALACSSNFTSCNAVVTFLPRSPGLKQDALILRASSGTVIASAFLHGIGTAPVLGLFPATISTLAGNGRWSYVNGAAAAASFRDPQGLAMDLHGNVYIADSINQVVRKLTVSTGAVSTLAGNGNPGFSGDGGAALSATLNTPTGVAVDAAGNVFIADQGNSLVRRVDAVSGFISTIAGGGNILSDGVQATTAALSGPNNVAVDIVGNVYIADSFHNVIRKVTAVTGVIATIAGGGSVSGSDGFGDGELATSAQLTNPTGLAFDSSGKLYIADTGHGMVRMVDFTTGDITAIAGTGSYGSTGDGSLAVNATLGSPTGIRLDAAGNIYIADSGLHRIRFVNSSTGVISTLAGNGTGAYTGDSSFSTFATLNVPSDIVLDLSGNILIADSSNNVIRKVTLRPPTLNFPSTHVTLTSSLVDVTLGNYGNANLTLSGLTVTSPFQQKASGGIDCTGASLLTPGGSCQVGIAFLPTVAAAVTGSLSVSSNSANNNSSQAVVNLGGTGLSGFPVASDSGNSLSFSSQAVGTTSARQSVTLTNTGSAALSGLDLQVSGLNAAEFSVTTTCQSTLAAGAACTINVTFTPLLAGTRSATVSIYDSAANSPQVISLTGTGSGGPMPQLSANSLQFGNSVINYAATAQVVTLTNAGTGSMTIGSVILSGTNTFDFAISDSTCGGALAASASCSVTVSFVPLAAGSRTADLLFTDSAGNSPQSVTLNGTGLVSSCSVSLNTASRLYLTPATTDVLTVTDTSGCTWAATSNVSWITFPGSNTGSVTGSLHFAISANTAAQPRTGTITIGAQTVAITQIGIGLRFTPITPCRVVDTRMANGTFGGPEIPGLSSRDFPLASGACGIPQSAQAYSINLTVVPSGPLRYVTIYPTGQVQPLVSTLNSVLGQIKADAAIIPAGTGGGITVFATDPTNVIIDVNGYFVPASDASALSFYPLPPCRVADTRNADGPLGGPTIPGLGTRDFPIPASTCNVPSTAQAYSLNFTVIPKAGTLSYLSTWPTGQPQPLVSTLNDGPGHIIANAAIVPAGDGGSISAFVTQKADLIIDINGYFAPAQSSGGLSLYNLSPCRILDTRLNAGTPFTGTIDVGPGECPVPSVSQAYVLNATALPAPSLRYLTLWPNGTTQPLVSTLNATTLTSNMAIVPTSNTLINAFATDPTHLILDLFGYFAP